MKHTPGPWEIKQFGGPQISGPKGYAVATMWGALSVRELKGQDLANARLIAAAPELLDVAERMMEALEFAYMGAPEQPKEIAQYRAVRAKIEGKQ